MLFKKMLRDMSRNKMQFVSIFLMSFLGVFVYAGIGGEWYGIESELFSYYEQTNFADARVYGTDMTELDARKIAAIDGVDEVELRLTLQAVGDFANNPQIELNYINDENISKLYIVDGEEYDRSVDGVWLDAKFASAKGLEVGDSLTMFLYGTEIEKDIVGLVNSPDYVFFSREGDMIPDRHKIGFAFISEDYFPKSMGMFYTQALIKTNRTDFEALKSEVDKALDGDYTEFVSKKDYGSNLSITNEMSQHKAMGNIFPVAFLAIAMLTILTTMTRMVSNQRTQIGSLKALGFKKNDILWHYVSYGFWLSLTGSFLGAVVGPYTIPYLFYTAMKTMYTLNHWGPRISPTFFGMAVISVIICTLASYFACRNVLRDTPAETLRPKAPKNVRHTAFEKTKLWHSLGFDVQWNLRDVTRGKARSLMAIVGVAGCTGLIICAFGFLNTMDDVISWQYDEINNFTTLMTVSESATESEIESIEHRFPTEDSMRSAIEVSSGKKSKNGVLTVTDATEYLRTTDVNRKLITIPDGQVGISLFMAEKLGVGVGDRVQWRLMGDDEWHSAKISVIYRNPTVQGLTMSESMYESLGNSYVYKPTEIYCAQEVKKLYDGITAVQQNNRQREVFDESIESMSMMIYILIVAAAVLAVVVLYNLGILSFTEKERELATLKVVGFKSRKLRVLMFMQNVWLTAVGIVCGFPFGFFLIDFMIKFMEIDMMTVLEPQFAVLSVILPFVFSAVVNIAFFGKINSIDMVSSLKGVE